MIRNTRHFMAPISLLGVVLMMLACGNESSDKSSSASARQEEQAINGRLYKSQLLPLNTIVAGNVIGQMEWMVSSSQMRLHLSMTNTPEDLEHFQAVHSGTRCPTENADNNGDGIIDIEELQKVSGPVLFPLDSDLSSNEKGDFSTSRANAYGNYVYWAEVDNKRIRSIASNLSPENRVVVVYGINQGYNLPSTVASLKGNTHRYVPISCGVVKQASVQKFH